MAKDIIIFWKGSAESYATLKLRGRIKPFGRYTVTSSDGTVREYLGTKLISNSNLEQLACVDDVMSKSLFTEKWNKGELTNIRLLVGDDNAFEDDGKKSLESGMNDHLSKPSEMDKLAAALQRVLKNG